MRRRFWQLAMLITIGLSSLFGYILANSVSLYIQNNRYKQWAQSLKLPDSQAQKLDQELRTRVDVYIREIEKTFLLDGMIISRDITGSPIDVCDSLLFSSLYFTALKKLGYNVEAERIWQAINKSNDKGQWFRHPQCREATSRDMLLGLLLAFTQKDDIKAALSKTIDFVVNNNGFISNGRFDVSYLTPGVAEYLRILAEANGLDYDQINALPYSFSTSEFSALGAPPGYSAHLIGLETFLEMELRSKPELAHLVEFRNSIMLIDAISKFTGISPERARISWVMEQIYEADSDNLFFKFMRLKAADALTNESRHLLMAELLAMPQFPASRLPENCDRSADYLWQRSSVEYYKKSDFCSYTFNGLDFVWMTALLLDGMGSVRGDNIAH